MLFCAFLTVAVLLSIGGPLLRKKRGLYWWPDSAGEDIFIGLIFSIGAAVIGPLIAWPLIVANADTTVVSNETPLAALGSASSTGGSFFLGSGTVDEDLVYRYLEQHDGYVVRGEIEAEDVRVYTDDNPRITSTHEEVHWPWLFPWKMEGRWSEQIYVPEGSIASEFEVAP